MKTGIVLEGGGFRGIYTAGVLDVFLEEGITFDGLIGTSAGAVHGCSYLSGQKGRSIRYYLKYYNEPKFMSIRNWLKTGNVVDTEFSYHELPEKLDPYDFAAFKKSTVPFFAACTNVESGEAEYIQITDMKGQIDVIRASASLPYFSRIVEFGGKKYLDGGCADAIPIEAFRKMGYERNVIVLTRPLTYEKKSEIRGMAKLKYRKYPKFVELMKKRHEIYNKTTARIRELEREGSVFVIRPESDLPAARMEHDPKIIQETYDRGVADAKAILEELTIWLNK